MTGIQWAIWTLIGLRALAGTVVAFITWRYARAIVRDIDFCLFHKINGAQLVVMRNQVQFAHARLFVIAMVTLQAWVVWPLVGRMPATTWRSLCSQLFLMAILAAETWTTVDKVLERQILDGLASQAKVKDP